MSTPDPVPPIAPTRAERALAGVAIVGLFAMAALITLNVVSRWIGRAIVPDDIQLVKELMVLVILLPLGVVTAAREHISVDLLTEGASPRARRLLDLLAHLVGLVLAGLITFAAWRNATDAWAKQDYYSGVLNIPMWIGHFAFVFGCGVFLLRLIALVVHDLRRPT